MTDNPKEKNLLFSLGTNGIPAKELVKILEEARFAFKEIAKASETEDAELKVYPFKQGSFEWIVAVTEAAAHVFGVFEKILGYKKARLEYEAAKRNHNWQKETKPLISPQPPVELQANPTINIHINAMLKVVGENSSGFMCYDPEGSNMAVSFSTYDINNLLEIEKERSKEKPERRTIEKIGQQLYLVKTSVKKYGMWEFIYDDIRIMAQVPDDVKKAAKIKSWPSGTKMTVWLSIRQEYDKLAKAWESINYRVTHVEHYEKP